MLSKVDMTIFFMALSYVRKRPKLLGFVFCYFVLIIRYGYVEASQIEMTLRPTLREQVLYWYTSCLNTEDRRGLKKIHIPLYVWSHWLTRLVSPFWLVSLDYIISSLFLEARDAVASWLAPSTLHWAWPGALCCALGQDTVHS